jgi:MmyB-like transcription regulator ligand binding domain
MPSRPISSGGPSIRTSSTGRGRPVNFARFVFLDPRAEEFFADWERAAKDVAALLRLEAGRNPFDRELSDLVGELSTRSEEFGGLWATHNVRLHTTGEKRFNHPVVGELELSYNRIDVAADPGLMIVTYTAEPGTRSQEALSLLASWAATRELEVANADREEQSRHAGRAE